MTDREPLANAEVRVDLLRDEILQTSSKITVNVRADADPDRVARAIRVLGVDGAAVPVEPGRFVWEARPELPPGWHTFVVEALTDANLQELSDRIEVPFYVVDTLAQFPASLRVESFVRLRLAADGFERLDPKSRPDGEFVDVLKAVQREDGMPVSIGFDQLGRELDAELQLQAHRAELLAARGKLDDTLRQKLSLLAPSDDVLIDAWFNVEEPEPLFWDGPLGEAELAALKLDEFELNARIRRRAREIVDDLQRGLPSGVVRFENPEDRVPVLTLRVPSEFVREIARNEAISAVFFHDESVFLDLASSISAAGSQHVHLAGITGVGVNVAVWETPPDPTANLFSSASYDPAPAAGETTVHSTVVHEIIRNNGINSPYGHAPGCSLFSANSAARDALKWAVDQQCSVINQSFHRGSEATSGTPTSYDLYQDYLASHSRRPLIVNAAGNLDDEGIMPPEAEYVNHKGYNTLSVGNHNESFWIDSLSTFRNPSSLHGDRELPEISANGTSVVAESLSSTGTSFAAPAVSGVAALIQETAQTLVHWPEGCRAILLAAAGPRHSAMTWWQDIVAHVDGVDGAGALNARESFEVAQARSARNAAPTPRGWDVGQLKAQDFGLTSQSVFNYRLSVPTGGQAAPRIRVALAWTSLTSQVPLLSTLDVDLDLAVYDANNVQVGFSGSWDNSYEIVDFVGVPGAVYSIKIRRKTLQVATRYGIAWTTHGRSRPPQPSMGDE